MKLFLEKLGKWHFQASKNKHFWGGTCWCSMKNAHCASVEIPLEMFSGDEQA